MTDHSTHPNHSSTELLVVSFFFPPLAYPRSVQVARLLKHARFSTVLVCADEKGARQDPTIEPGAEARLRACLRTPFSLDGWRRQVSRVASHLHLPLWHKIPDEYASWQPAALRIIKNYERENHYRPDIILSFGQPMSDHLIGLKLKKTYRAPWIAHFSDPWMDNIFNRYDALTRKVNLRLEQMVVRNADRLIFTSPETIDLVMAKYTDEERAKARVLPHSFDASLYLSSAKNDLDEITIRYIGEFYGQRNPKPLVNALQSILSTTPQLLTNVRFEFIGPVNPQAMVDAGMESLPEGLVVTKPAVDYQESLRLAASADGLLIVDAPAKRSVFLPSKLIDYIGAGRPILGITPPGTAATVINDLGGWVADTTDLESIKQELKSFLSYLSQNREGHSHVWGEPSARKRYEAAVVAESFENIVRELLT